jgi:hypothetical protein
MRQIPVYQYTIPLEETEDGLEPAYEYPEGNVINKYEKGRELIIIQDKVVPQLHKDSVAVKVDVLVEDEISTIAGSS